MISFIALTIIVAWLITFALYLGARAHIRRNTTQRLISMVSIAALQVDADANATLTDPSQEGNATYLSIKHTLQKIRNASENVRYVYTARYINNQMVFIVDAETDPANISHLGDVYEEATPTALSLISSATKPYVEPGISSDKWGAWITGCAPLYLSNGQRGDSLCMDISYSDVLKSERQLLWIALAIFAGMIPIATAAGWLMGNHLVAPLTALIAGTERLAAGDLHHRVSVSTRDETAKLAEAFNMMADRLSDMIEGLEQRVAERTFEIGKRSTYLEAAAEIGRFANSILVADQLVIQVIELIRERFNLYYVGLFMLSDDGKWAILRSGTGDAGKAMLERKHKIKVGEGMVGWCIANSQARVAREVQEDSVHLATVELPETCSEAALPLRARDRVIGAITVQSIRADAFDETAITALQSMADHIAVALENARLFSRNQEALATAQQAYGELSRASWVDLLSSRSYKGYYCDEDGVVPLDEGQSKQDLTSLTSPQVLRLPIRIRGQALGTILARKAETDGEWSSEEIGLLEALTDQLSVALDNARLYSDTQSSAERAHIISDISAKVRSATSVKIILQTAVKELAEALHISKASIQLLSGSGNGDTLNE
jgi:GAF domain-containing protein/HAMP domain-containing protein